MGEEHLRLFHKGREFFAFPPTGFGSSLDNNCGHYSWPPARDAHPLSLAPTGSLKLLLPDSTDCWNICPVWFDQWPLKCFFYGRDLFLFWKIFLWKKSLIWHATDNNIRNLEPPKTGLVTTRKEEVNGAKILVCQVVAAQFPETSCTTQPCFQRSLREKTRTADSAHHPPVTRLETTRGKISIFSILIRISPGKAMIITTSGGRGDMCRSSIPAMEPRKTPAPQREREGRDTDAVRGKKTTRLLSIEAPTLSTTTRPAVARDSHSLIIGSSNNLVWESHSVALWPTGAPVIALTCDEWKTRLCWGEGNKCRECTGEKQSLDIYIHTNTGVWFPPAHSNETSQ